MGTPKPTHKPDYWKTEPPIDIPPHSKWSNLSKIISFDPWGHLIPSGFAKEIESSLDIRQGIAIAKAHLKMSKLDDTARKGDIVVDGSIVLNKEWTGVECGWLWGHNSTCVVPSWLYFSVPPQFLQDSSGLCRIASQSFNVGSQSCQAWRGWAELGRAWQDLSRV